MSFRFGRLPLLWQTLWLIVFTLIASGAVSIFFTMAFPQPRLDFYALRDIAESLDDPRGLLRGRYSDPQLTVSTVAEAPTTDDSNMRTHAQISSDLAAQLKVPVERVRLFYKADQTNFPFRYKQNDAGVPLRLGEPQFYNTVIAAVQQDDGSWRMVRTPERPTITRVQRRIVYNFIFALLLVLPLAYLFARQMSDPIKRFVAAAERAGADNAPAVPLEGSVEMRNAAQAINAMQKRLADMLAERTAMIGAIAHDLRTPLARIAFRIEGAPDSVRSAVMNDIEQMRAMIAATIAFMRPGGGELLHMRPVDLSQILAVIAANGQAMGHDLTFEPQAGWMLGDELALGRLFQNVVDNALTYGGGAKVAIRTEDGRVVVTVADQGPGIPESMLDDVFKPFNRGDPSRNRATGGVGLGLSIARSIAIAHGGMLHARNRPEGGLLMTATFPAIAAPGDAILVAGDSRSPADGQDDRAAA
ncbi:ATP-binding protein [Polymorphobacter sp.]|uniref:ATP-binding protein n=1 Tax=Polymorphobacter sp. TaxID=1909290 RepID=UPI003F7201B8